LPPELINSWSGSGVYSSFTTSSNLDVTQNYDAYSNYISITTASSTDYKISILRNGVLVFQSNTLNGNQVIDLSSLGVSFDIAQYTFFIQSQIVITINVMTLNLGYFALDAYGISYIEYDQFNTTLFNTNNTFVFDIAQQIPEIKVIDFLSGIFRMFNLTAYVENGIVIVKTLNDFYATSNVYDITPHIKVDSNTVNVALPFKQIEFGYEDTKTLLALKHSQQFNYDWAKEIYNELPEIDGGIYKVTLPFSHFKYERIFDVNAPTTPLDIQWGYSATDNFNAATGNYEAA
jgi:hypothetical protein